MALPALAQATGETLESFQFAEAIAGVRSAKVMANGDVQLTTLDGRKLIVSAENIQILENGSIMIADEAATEIAQLAVAEVAGAAATGGGISGAGLALGGLGIAGAAAGAGGGGGDSDDDDRDEEPSVTKPAPALPSLNLAELQSNALSNASTETSAPGGTASVEVSIGSLTKTATPAVDGSWSVSLTQAEAEALSQGATTVTVRHLDADGVELSVETAQFDVDTVPPMLSIDSFSVGAIMNAAEQAAGLTITGTTDAENGQTVTVSLNGQTYSSTVSNGAWSVSVPASDLAALSDASTISVTADVVDQAGNPAMQASGGFDTDFSAPSLTLNPVAGGSIDLIDVSADLVLNGTTNAEDGQQVSLSFNGQSYTGTVSGGGWSVTIPSADLADLETGTPADITVAVNDSAGNPATPVSVSVPVDLTGPSIAIDPLSVGEVLNAAEVGSDLVVNGTVGNVTDGQTVTVTLDGQTYAGTVSGGHWSVTIPSGDLATLADGAAFSITADVSDADGLDAPQAEVALAKDATPPTLSIDAFSTGSVMNATEQGSDLVVTGSTSAEDGQTVTLTFDGQAYTALASGESWSITIPSSDLVTLTDGATVNVTANVTDSAANPATQATSSFDTDFSAPNLSISALSSGSVLNLAEQAGGLTVNGTSDAADGSQITVEIRHSDGSLETLGTTTVIGGLWSYIASAGDLSGLQDGETYQVNASVADAAGNSASANTSFDTDLSAPTLLIDTVSAGGVLDVLEQGTDLQISGTTNAEDGQTVTVNLNGQDYSATVTGGSWVATVPAADLSALPDATNFTITASVEDAAGNSAPDTTTSLTTDFQPILTMTSVGTNDAVSLSDLQTSGTTITGSSAGLSAGQAVAITLNGTPMGSATVAADGSWSLNISAAQFSSVEAGDSLEFEAQASVASGPDPTPVSDQVVAHVPAAYTIVEAGQSGSTITFEVYADPDRDTSAGLSFTAELEYDPNVATYDLNTEIENGDFDLFLSNPQSASAISFAGAATSFSDVSQPIMTFTMTVQDPGQPIILTLTTPDGGPSQLHLGTDDADTLIGSAIDDVVRGGGGDDTIDITGAGRDVIVFEADPAVNGADTITGFTLGPATDLSDAIMFSGLDVSNLRGDGTGFETLSLGSTIWNDTGFVVLQGALSD
ncbi:MAG: Ig-like domain-containing protein [Pseudomonadota bacterium]